MPHLSLTCLPLSLHLASSSYSSLLFYPHRQRLMCCSKCLENYELEIPRTGLTDPGHHLEHFFAIPLTHFWETPYNYPRKKESLCNHLGLRELTAAAAATTLATTIWEAMTTAPLTLSESAHLVSLHTSSGPYNNPLG